MYEIYTIPALMQYTKNYIYYLIDKQTGLSAVIDPGDDAPILEFLQKNNFKPHFIVNTHHHWDHVNGNLKVKNATGAKIVASAADAYRIPGVDITLEFGQNWELGNISFSILHTPGHTKNHIALYSEKEKLLFCGDVMFSGGCGGLFEGTAEEMFSSFEKYITMPDEIAVYCAHEYTENNLEFALSLEPTNEEVKKRMLQVKFLQMGGKPTVPSTILIEKLTNPFMRYRELRKVLNLPSTMTDCEVFCTIMLKKQRFYA